MSTIKQDTSANSAAADYDPARHSYVDSDSNCQSTDIVAPAGHLVQRLGGADNQTDTGMSGGRELI